MGPLTPDGQRPPMPKTPVASKIHEPFNIHIDFTSQITLDLDVVINNFSDIGNLFLGQIIGVGVETHSGTRQDVLRCGPADTVNIRKGYFGPLIFW
jgi:hypothetical protein